MDELLISIVITVGFVLAAAVLGHLLTNRRKTPMTETEIMGAYLEACKSKIPRIKQGVVERGGYFLLTSAGRTGQPILGDAISRALHAGEVDVAVELASRLIPETEAEVRYTGNGNFSVSGQLDTAQDIR